jgi:hypothetical protein
MGFKIWPFWMAVAFKDNSLIQFLNRIIDGKDDQIKTGKRRE